MSEPAATEQVSWDPEALLHLVAQAAGYPYFLQQFGQDTWNHAPGPDRITLADDEDLGSGSRDVAVRLGRQITSLGPVRAKFIAKGLIYAPEHGVVAFTVPGMADFISRQPQQ